jgi:hypothetical protein
MNIKGKPLSLIKKDKMIHFFGLGSWKQKMCITAFVKRMLALEGTVVSGLISSAEIA